MPAPFRDAVERRSIVLLTYLNLLPRALPFAAVAALMMVGLLTSGVPAFLALTVVAVFLGWLLYIGWPHLLPGPRLVRLLATLLVAVMAASRLFAG